MFNDEAPFTFQKMHQIGVADGFVEISENLADMIKYVANEPSVGLFYIQQHAQSAVPNLINLKNGTKEKSRNMILHTEDLEDSITMVRSMKGCGLPIANEMIKEIKKSLAIMSTKQPKRGLIQSPSLGLGIGRANSLGQDVAVSGSYLSTVLKSAKLRASSFKWPHLDLKEPRQAKGEEPISSGNPPTSVVASSTSYPISQPEADELPVSSQIADDVHEGTQVHRSLSSQELLILSDNYDEFRAVREAKLEEWLEGTGNQNDPVGGTKLLDWNVIGGEP